MTRLNIAGMRSARSANNMRGVNRTNRQVNRIAKDNPYESFNSYSQYNKYMQSLHGMSLPHVDEQLKTSVLTDVSRGLDNFLQQISKENMSKVPSGNPNVTQSRTSFAVDEPYYNANILPFYKKLDTLIYGLKIDESKPYLFPNNMRRIDDLSADLLTPIDNFIRDFRANTTLRPEHKNMIKTLVDAVTSGISSFQEVHNFSKPDNILNFFDTLNLKNGIESIVGTLDPTDPDCDALLITLSDYYFEDIHTFNVNPQAFINVVRDAKKRFLQVENKDLTAVKEYFRDTINTQDFLELLNSETTMNQFISENKKTLTPDLIDEQKNKLVDFHAKQKMFKAHFEKSLKSLGLSDITEFFEEKTTQKVAVDKFSAQDINYLVPKFSNFDEFKAILIPQLQALTPTFTFHQDLENPSYDHFNLALCKSYFVNLSGASINDPIISKSVLFAAELKASGNKVKADIHDKIRDFGLQNLQTSNLNYPVKQVNAEEALESTIFQVCGYHTQAANQIQDLLMDRVPLSDKLKALRNNSGLKKSLLQVCETLYPMMSGDVPFTDENGDKYLLSLGMRTLSLNKKIHEIRELINHSDVREYHERYPIDNETNTVGTVFINKLRTLSDSDSRLNRNVVYHNPSRFSVAGIVGRINVAREAHHQMIMTESNEYDEYVRAVQDSRYELSPVSKRRFKINKTMNKTKNGVTNSFRWAGSKTSSLWNFVTFKKYRS